MVSLSHPIIHPIVGIGINTLAALATQKADWYPQGMLSAAIVAANFSTGQRGTILLIKSAKPLEKVIGLGAHVIATNKGTKADYDKNFNQNNFRLKKVARAVGGLIFALGLSKLLNRSSATPISMKAAAAFCIIPTLLLLNESQPKPRKHKQVS